MTFLVRRDTKTGAGHDEDLGIMEAESRGEPVSKSPRKRCGKLSVRVKGQFNKLLQGAEEAVQLSAEKDIRQRLTKAELKKTAAKFRAEILGVTKLLKGKFPIEKRANFLHFHTRSPDSVQILPNVSK